MCAGAAALGLQGTVASEPLLRVLAGEHPATGEPLGRVLAARRPGFDLTFSAPKSVSVLFGIGDDRLRSTLRAAHDQAVADALGYMERQAAVTRRGPAGVHAIAGNGLVAAGFRHRTSRAGDPQLHTHVLVANLTLGADGRWTTLDARASMRTRRRRATSTRLGYAACSPMSSAWSGPPCATASPRSPA